MYWVSAVQNGSLSVSRNRLLAQFRPDARLSQVVDSSDTTQRAPADCLQREALCGMHLGNMARARLQGLRRPSRARQQRGKRRAA